MFSSRTSVASCAQGGSGSESSSCRIDLPATGGEVVQPFIRQTYFCGLEVADNLRRSSVTPPPATTEVIDKGPAEAGEAPQPGSYPKSRPPKKEETEGASPAPSAPKEAEPLPRKRTESNKVKKKKESISPERSLPKEERSPKQREEDSSRAVKEEPHSEGEEKPKEPTKKKKSKKKRERESRSRSRHQERRRRTPYARRSERRERSPRRSPLQERLGREVERAHSQLQTPTRQKSHSPTASRRREQRQEEKKATGTLQRVQEWKWRQQGYY